MIALFVTAALGQEAYSSESMPPAADHLALFLLGTVVLTYGALLGWGFAVWRRSRRPQAPHEELIATLQSEERREMGIKFEAPPGVFGDRDL